MRIFLVRHGESLGNVDEAVYADLQDHNVPLTSLGHLQAYASGLYIRHFYEQREDLKGKQIRVWYSPFLRAVETKDEILRALGPDLVETAREDFLLREQNFGIFSDIPDEREQKKKFPHEFAKYARCREKSGKFYAQPPMGESRADVAFRVRLFVDTIMRDVAMEKEDIVIVAHGVTNRAFEMTFLHRDVAWFEQEPNPPNGAVFLIEGDRVNGYTAGYVYKPEITLPSAPPAPPKMPRKRTSGPK